MLAAHCPCCGAPNPVSLATPERQRCHHCKYDGAPSPETQGHLQRARDVLLQQDAGERTLDALQRRTLLSAWWQKLKFAIVLLLLTVPFVFFAGTCSLMSGQVAWWVVALMGFLPLLVMLASGAFGAWIIARARRKLEDACAATPPRAAGEPASCHVCGAPLSPAAGEVLCSCGFCRADNVVAPDVLERMRHRSRNVFDRYEAEIHTQAHSLGAHSARAVRVTLAAAVAAPLLSVGAMIVVALALTMQEDPVNADVEYVAWRTGEGVCLGKLWRKAGGTFVIEFTFPPPGGAGKSIAATSLEGVRVFRATQLVGKQAFTMGGVGTVQRVYGDALLEGENRAAIVLPDKGQHDLVIQGMCLAGAASSQRLNYEKNPGKSLTLIPQGIATTSRRELVQIAAAGGATKTRLDASRAAWVAADGDVLWVATDRQLYRRKGQGNLEVVAPRTQKPKGMATAGDSVWVASSTAVERFDASGPQAEIRTSNFLKLAADATGTYVLQNDGVYQVDGSQLRSIAPLPGLTGALALDDSYVYVGVQTQIERIHRQSEKREILYKDSSEVSQLAAVDGTLFWARTRAGKYAAGLIQYDLGSQNLTNLDLDVDGPVALAADATQVVWLTRDGSVIRRKLSAAE